MIKKLRTTLFILIAGGLAFFLYSKYRIPPTIEFHQLSLTDLDSNSVNLNDFAGKNIFITFWAPWCIDCIKEMPDLQFVKDNLKNKDFVFLAISGYDFEKEKRFVSKNNFDLTFLHMSNQLKDINIHSIPTNYIINKNGKVVYEKVGAEKDWKSEETLQMIKNLVN